MGDLVQSGSKYTDEQRRQAVLEHSLFGSLEAVSRSMNIPRKTLSHWKTTEWWQQVSAEVQGERDELLLAQHTAIALKASEVVLDRLENGDTKIVKGDSGFEAVKVPVSARDASVAGGIAFDKRRLALSQPTSIRGGESNEAMKDLVKKFEELAQTSRERVISDQ